jgi:transcription elongation factor S-II
MSLREQALNIIKHKCGFLNKLHQTDLEQGIYNYSIDEAKKRGTKALWENPEFQTIYRATTQRTISNIDTTSYIGNPRLKQRLIEGEFKPHDIPFMTYNELYPEKWHDMMEMAVKREAKMLEVDKSMATDMFKCTRCGKRQCTYYEMQTRSADEPMTQFIRCLNCGKQWRQ